MIRMTMTMVMMTNPDAVSLSGKATRQVVTFVSFAS